ncbi:unnamed protein product [Phytophthora lilii]|uniref:Unnamed protein product n=1 Tax=Phytophthora lilii TaxID=2077276 RepID=A0A9W6UBU0_9STRA|nr:unnamed protein product [Phytophthora lilii]
MQSAEFNSLQKKKLGYIRDWVKTNLGASVLEQLTTLTCFSGNKKCGTRKELVELLMVLIALATYTDEDYQEKTKSGILDEVKQKVDEVWEDGKDKVGLKTRRFGPQQKGCQPPEKDSSTEGSFWKSVYWSRRTEICLRVLTDRSIISGQIVDLYTKLEPTEAASLRQLAGKTLHEEIVSKIKSEEFVSQALGEKWRHISDSEIQELVMVAAMRAQYGNVIQPGNTANLDHKRIVGLEVLLKINSTIVHERASCKWLHKVLHHANSMLSAYTPKTISTKATALLLAATNRDLNGCERPEKKSKVSLFLVQTARFVWSMKRGEKGEFFGAFERTLNKLDGSIWKTG